MDDGQINDERKEIVKLFPTLDLSDIFAEYSHLSSEALIEIILQKHNQIPKKPKFSARFYVKACSFLVGVAKLWPSWLGGHLFCNVVKAIENSPENRVNPIKDTMDCCVCWDSVPVTEMCFCDHMTSISELVSNGTHWFCRDCLEKHAKVALEEMPLANGGLGLRCMMHECENPIIFHEIASFVSPEIAAKLEERSAMISVAQAGLNNLERCRNCNCAVELGKSATKMQVFRCPDCRYEFCRLCGEQWQNEHEGLSCEEFLRKKGCERILEKRLNEAIVHTCYKCKMAFVKSDGCNRVTCKCGATQCYICRSNDIDYAHFCRCFNASKRNNDGTYLCMNKDCKKKCLLFENPDHMERTEMDRIRREVYEQELKDAKKKAVKNADAGTSDSNVLSKPSQVKKPLWRF